MAIKKENKKYPKEFYKKLDKINSKIKKLKLYDFYLSSNKSVNNITIMITSEGLRIFNTTIGESVELTEQELCIFSKNFKKILKSLVVILKEKDKKIRKLIKILSR